MASVYSIDIYIYAKTPSGRQLANPEKALKNKANRATKEAKGLRKRANTAYG